MRREEKRREEEKGSVGEILSAEKRKEDNIVEEMRDR